MHKLTWPEAGMVREPGQYESRFGLVEITADDLAVWTRFPQAAFTVTGLSPDSSAERILRLGAFELRTNSNYSTPEK
jgi:hypothetical protein